MAIKNTNIDQFGHLKPESQDTEHTPTQTGGWQLSGKREVDGKQEFDLEWPN